MGKAISDDKLLELLLTHGSVRSASAACGLSQNAIYRRLQDEAFRARYDSMQGILLQTAAASMSDMLQDAVKVLKDVASNVEVSAQVRVNAADCILRHCLRYAEVSDVLARIERLERAAEQNTNY